MDVSLLKLLLNYLACINCAVDAVGIYKVVMPKVVLVFMMDLIGLLDNLLLLVSMISTNIMILRKSIYENHRLGLYLIHDLIFSIDFIINL